MESMIEAVGSQNIDERRLDKRFYTLSLTAEAERVGLFGERRLAELRRELAEALARQIELFTGGESSSVESATAARLMRSILYNTDLALLRCGTREAVGRLLSSTIESIYYDGLTLNRELNLKARSILRRVKAGRIPTACIYYNRIVDTALGELIRGYDDKLDAASPAAVDYLMPTIRGELRGIGGMLRLVTELESENRFVGGFPREGWRALERRYHRELMNPAGEMINLGQLCFTHAMLSLMAVGEPVIPFELSLSRRLSELYSDRDAAYSAYLTYSDRFTGEYPGRLAAVTASDVMRIIGAAGDLGTRGMRIL